MHNAVRGVLLPQVVLTLLAALGIYLWKEQVSAVWAVIYGGGIAWVNALLAIRRAKRAVARVDDNVTWSTFTLYAGVIERFVFTLVAFGLGMGTLKLAPVALLLGFAVAQAGYLMGTFKGVGVSGR